MNTGKYYYVFFITLILFQYSGAQSNEGTEFWFAFLEHRDPTNSKKCIITSKYNTSGVIEIPSIGWRTNFTVAANNVFIVDVPDESELLQSEVVTKQGVHVTTQKPSSVYIHQYFRFRADAALVLPVESLGTFYFVMSYRGYQNEDDHYPSEFSIIGTEDNTLVQITYAANTALGKKKNEKHSVTLNRGETYQVQAATVNDDLTGTYIESDKFVSVFSGNRWTQIPNGFGNRDNLLEQMYPLEVWGKQFVSIPSKTTIVDRYRILASQDNTIVTLSGSGTLPGPYNLNKGQWVEFELNAEASFIQANAPIMVAQFLVGGESNGLNGEGDPSMVLLNSLEQMRDTVTIYNSPYQNINQQFINILTLSKDTANLNIDGRTLTQRGDAYQLIGPKNEFAFCQLNVTQGPHLITSAGCGVIAIAYGYGMAESYAYGGGANFYKFNNIPIPDGSCFKDSLEFKSGLPQARFDVSWDLGDGTVISKHQFKYTYAALGQYKIKLLIHDLCRNVFDSTTKIINITLREKLEAYPDTLICEGSDVQFKSLDRPQSTYEWTGPDNFKSDKQNPIINSIQKKNEGTYSVIGTYFGCSTFPKSLELKVSENPVPQLGNDTFFCPDKASIKLSTHREFNILWEDGSSNIFRTITEEGIYSVKLTNEYGCSGEDSILIEDKCPLEVYIPNIFSPNGDHINDYFRIESSHIDKFFMEIFTRWGERVFTTESITGTWNGLLRDGREANPGVYLYHITVNGYNTKGEYITENLSGDLTLIR